MQQIELTDSNTWREIHSQPTMWRQALLDNRDKIANLRYWIAHKQFSHIILSGAGSSAYIGSFIARCHPAGKLYSIPTTDIVSVPHDFFGHYPKPLMVQFGRSGNSFETTGLLALLDQLAPTFDRLHISCNPAGALASRTQSRCETETMVVATHDQGFAMTASFTTMLLLGLILFSQQTLDDWAEKVEQLADTGAKLLQLLNQFNPAIAERAIFLGSGPLEIIAREMSLKVLELTAGASMTAWDTPLGFRHGPKSALGNNSQVYLLQHPHSYTQNYERDLLHELTRQFPALQLTNLGQSEEVAFPSTGQVALDGLLYAVVGQVIGAKWSHQLRLNVDNPFINSGNLTRVVSGITLYQYK